MTPQDLDSQSQCGTRSQNSNGWFPNPARCAAGARHSRSQDSEGWFPSPTHVLSFTVSGLLGDKWDSWWLSWPWRQDVYFL